MINQLTRLTLDHPPLIIPPIFTFHFLRCNFHTFTTYLALKKHSQTLTSWRASIISACWKTPRPVDFMDSKLEALVGSSRNYDFMGNGDLGMVSGLGDMSHHHGLAPNFSGFCSSFGMSLDGNSGTFHGNLPKINASL
ncbi:hypothetical protein OIU79_025541 [Salix purpurea]|uniref:Uncharacterized protein n=1 Tax=Salix purpurea TaxID=77065 RepID=A0A9Q0W7N6_SALPP|nr:hypothetical protein OIU79_025541 [Salix purpurea]